LLILTIIHLKNENRGLYTVPQDCRPDIKYVRRVFGVDLTTLTLAHKTDVPGVLLACVHEIEARGLDQEGIYRVSGSHDEIERLRQTVDLEGRVDLTQDKVRCIVNFL